jgi:hypothetical protein
LKNLQEHEFSHNRRKVAPAPRQLLCAIIAQFLRNIYIKEGNIGRTDEVLLAEILKASRILGEVWSTNKNHIKALAMEGLKELLRERVAYSILPPRPPAQQPLVPPATIQPAKRHPRIRLPKKGNS